MDVPITDQRMESTCSNRYTPSQIIATIKHITNNAALRVNRNGTNQY